MNGVIGICQGCSKQIEITGRGDPTLTWRMLFMCLPCAEAYQKKTTAKALRCSKELRENPIAKLARALDRARRAKLPATMTLEELDRALRYFNHGCAYCQKNEAHLIEHATPISRGGGTTADNCLPACIDCNQSKTRKTIEEWAVRRTRNRSPPPSLAFLHSIGRSTEMWDKALIAEDELHERIRLRFIASGIDPDPLFFLPFPK